MLRIGLPVVVALALAGCSKYNQPVPKAQMVQGKVASSSGRPVTTGRIQFRPLQQGPGGWADVRKDGTFGFKEGDGLPAGKYKPTYDAPALKIEDRTVNPDTVEITDGRNQLSLTVQ